jgi:hypothetical protein
LASCLEWSPDYGVTYQASIRCEGGSATRTSSFGKQHPCVYLRYCTSRVVRSKRGNVDPESKQVTFRGEARERTERRIRCISRPAIFSVKPKNSPSSLKDRPKHEPPGTNRASFGSRHWTINPQDATSVLSHELAISKPRALFTVLLQGYPWIRSSVLMLRFSNIVASIEGYVPR